MTDPGKALRVVYGQIGLLALLGGALVLLDMGREHFIGNDPVQQGVARLVDDTHTAPAQFLNDLIPV